MTIQHRVLMEKKIKEQRTRGRQNISWWKLKGLEVKEKFREKMERR